MTALTPDELAAAPIPPDGLAEIRRLAETAQFTNLVAVRSLLSHIDYLTGMVAPQWEEWLVNDGEYEYTRQGDCHGTWEQKLRRRPALHGDPGPWEKVGDPTTPGGGQDV